MGEPAPDESVPWSWSDPYDSTSQMAGVSTGHDEVVLRGDAETGRSFAALSLGGGRLIGADCVARPREFMLATKLIAHGGGPGPQLLTDESVGARDLRRQLLT